MKNIFFSILFLIFPFFGTSQVVEVEFGNHLSFNCGLKTSYEEIIDQKNMISKDLMISGKNKYVIDLDNKEITLFYNNIFVGKEKIIEYETKGNLLYITLSDVELLTNKVINSHIIVNTDKTDKNHPYFTFYFKSTIDNTTNGYVSL